MYAHPFFELRFYEIRWFITAFLYQKWSTWPVSAMLTNTAHKCLPGGATPHLNKNATKEHYTHETAEEGKGGNVPMEQNWEEKESCK